MSKILTIDSFVSRVYSNMKQSSKRREHTIPTFTKIQLKEWFFSQKNFKELWNNWICSGFDRMLAPSADRVNNSIGYLFTNLELKTWKENMNKDIKYNSYTAGMKTSKKVLRFCKQGIMLDEFESLREASRSTGIDRRNITVAIKGKRRKTAGGYIWEYKNNS